MKNSRNLEKEEVTSLLDEVLEKVNMVEFIIETIFSLGLFINAGLFIPQIIKLYKTKNSKGFSLLTFGGFNIIQLFTVLHGFLHEDLLLIIGTTLSLVTCGCVSVMVVLYREK